jgi:hypothetical protein
MSRKQQLKISLLERCADLAYATLATWEEAQKLQIHESNNEVAAAHNEVAAAHNEVAGAPNEVAKASLLDPVVNFAMDAAKNAGKYAEEYRTLANGNPTNKQLKLAISKAIIIEDATLKTCRLCRELREATVTVSQ